MQRQITIAIEGCCHGALDNIYHHLQQKERTLKKKVDLLIICGDFQAIRNITDLESMSCPNKYKQLGGFYRYYTGERVAPVPTVFVGGNHEAGNHMRELYYGGWVAPNIYYMGNSGVIRFGGLRIGGISGIFKDFDYAKGYYEKPPFRGNSRPSMHHVRSYEAFKVLQIRQPLDIVVSHDWPQNIERFGDLKGLLRHKPYFKDEIERGDLGSPVNAMLLERLRPQWWFSAHLHSRFEAKLNSQDVLFDKGWSGIAPYNTVMPKQDSISNVDVTSAAVGDALNTDEIAIDGFSDDSDCEGDKGGASHCSSSSAQPAAASRPRMPLNLPPPKYSAIAPQFDPSEQDTEQQPPLDTADDVSASKTTETAAAPTQCTGDTDAKSTERQANKVSSPCVAGRATNFLALDKCLPRRQFLEIITVNVEDDSAQNNVQLQLEYDPEWLAILRMCHPHMPLDEHPFIPPVEYTSSGGGSHQNLPLFSDEKLEQELEWVRDNVFTHGRVFIPPNFVPMAPVPPPGTPDTVSFGLASMYPGGNNHSHNRGGGRGGRGRGHGRGGYSQGHGRQPEDVPWVGPRPEVIYPNPQTDELCLMIGIQDKLTQRRY
ncbi:lariat debranching enzyme [Coemansia sp. Benny D115]|nr:lariat debranching enzyme [Coemansia sp. Benny D115]